MVLGCVLPILPLVLVLEVLWVLRGPQQEERVNRPIVNRKINKKKMVIMVTYKECNLFKHTHTHTYTAVGYGIEGEGGVVVMAQMLIDYIISSEFYT